jgi:S1-C subfamily serine protease
MREIINLKVSNEVITENLAKGKHKAVYAPANLEGSAFALNNLGYIITSSHMVKGADSIFIQNNYLDRTLAKVVLIDPKLDLAILKIINSEITQAWKVPFAIIETPTDIGEKVYTLGYPRKEMVYGEGSLSSLSGYSNDTSMYQISIPLNPGNSGGPLIDEYGNVIGVVSGKNQNAEGTSFASKSIYINQIINSIHDDDLKNDLMLSKRSALRGLKRSEQIKRISPFVFNVYVYKGN